MGSRVGSPDQAQQLAQQQQQQMLAHQRMQVLALCVAGLRCSKSCAVRHLVKRQQFPQMSSAAMRQLSNAALTTTRGVGVFFQPVSVQKSSTTSMLFLLCVCGKGQHAELSTTHTSYWHSRHSLCKS